MKPLPAIATAIILISLPACAGEPAPVPSRIESIGMFKNGLCLVRRIVEVPGPGLYRLDALPRPVHGTWWIESDAVVHTRSTTVDVDVPRGAAEPIDVQQDLAGSRVTVFFADGSIPPATGTVLANESKQEKNWDRAYQPPARSPWHWQPYRNAPPHTQPPRYLILQTEKGVSYIERSHIACLQSTDPSPTVTRQEPALLFDVAEITAAPATITILYLTKGLAWAPGYQVDITDPHTLSLRQKAVIRNELEPLNDVELHLISGFPSIEFSHVLSPLAPASTWATFFTQLSQQPQPGNPHASVTQQRVVMNTVEPTADVAASAIPTGDGVDLHYQSIGRHSLNEGDTLSLAVAAAGADYARIVEWVIPDTRLPNGRYVEDYQRQQDPEAYDESAWDALRFRNPLSLPLTTGPAMVVDRGRFNGQHILGWANPGEETTLRITQALSLRTTHLELESPDTKREMVHYGGRPFRKVRVMGNVRANNYRAEPVELVIRRRFSGELASAEGSPRERLLESGVYTINKRNELVWSVSLDPGGETELDYEYDVLVYH